MQLNDLKSAWEQMKLIHSLEPIISSEVLDIIEQPQSSGKGKAQSILLNVVVFIIITMICQSG